MNTHSSNFDPLTQTPFMSPFLTTRRNVFLDLCANLIIYPAYIICIDKLIIHIVEKIPQFSVLSIILWAIAIYPMIAISGSDINWRLGFKKRKRVFAICIALIFTFLYMDGPRAMYLFFLTNGFTLAEFLVQRIIARKKLKNPYFGYWFYVLAIILAFLLVSIYIWYQIHTFIINAIFVELTMIIYGGIILSIPIPLVLGIQDSWDSYFNNQKDKDVSKRKLKVSVDLKNAGFLLRLFWRVLAYVFILGLLNISRILNLPENNFAIAMLGLAIILLLADPVDFYSRQQANLRQVTQWVRKDFIRTLVSPGSTSSNPLRVGFYKGTTFFQKNQDWILYSCVLVLGGVVLPVMLYHYKIEKDILILLKLSLITVSLLGGILGASLLIRNRPKNIVLPFVAVESKNDNKLKVTANLLRQSFLDQLHHISFLLNLRQVENLSIRDNRGLAVFVASGSNQELAETLNSLGNFEVADIKLPFKAESFFSTLIQHWADTQVRGTLQRREDNAIAIWVEFAYKNGQTVGVDLVMLPDDDDEESHNFRVNEIAYALAVKLVLKLGYHSHIATSYDSMRAFLDGLNASYQRKWWHAISNFHRAVHIEGVENKSFGYGYYHLGALLMSQGEVADGMKYLEHAEASGPPLAETQYMLALGLYYQYQDELHLNRNIFTDIEYKCKIAISLRRDFPEVYHLLGSAYYQRGRLREQAWTRCLLSEETTDEYPRYDPIPRHYSDDYHKSRAQLLKAIRLYDRFLRNLSKDTNVRKTVFNEQARLVEDRMAATHRLADVLRCLKLYSEADGYYREALIAFPRNNRTLVDLSKTYCLAKNWGKADEFLRNEVFNYPELKWDKSASFYMAWSLLGGVSENANSIKRFVDKWFISLYERAANRKDASALVRENNADEKKIWDAVCWLDYALHQYPIYLYRWQQLDWQKTFKQAIKWVKAISNNLVATNLEVSKKSGKSPKKQLQAIYSSLISDDAWSLLQVQYWIAWRILGNAYGEDEKSLEGMANALVSDIDINNSDKLLIKKNWIYPDPSIENLFMKMKEIRLEYMKNKEKYSAVGKEKSLQKRFDCLRLGIKAYKTWKEVFGNTYDWGKRPQDDLAKRLGSRSASITFGERWALDVFADFSLLTAKLLFEGKAYEYVHAVANAAGKVLCGFVDFCDNNCKDHDTLFLGGKVAKYQLSTLYAWEVYAELLIRDDVATKARMGKPTYYPDISELEMLIDKALTMNSYNPLALFVKSMLYQQRNLAHLAADELTRLSNIVAPFNPHKFVKRNLSAGNFLQAHKKSKVSPNLYYLKERVHGRRQIDDIVNLANIHKELANIYASIGESQFVISHLNQSICYSSSNDLTAELFLQLAVLLTKQERFQEAITATEEAKGRHKDLSQFEHKTSKCIEPFVLECILATYVENYSLALDLSSNVRKELSVSMFYTRHDTLIQEVKNDYSEVEMYIEKYKKELETFYADKDRNLNNGVELSEEDDINNQMLWNDFPIKAALYGLQPHQLAIFLQGIEPKPSNVYEYIQAQIMGSQIIALLSRDCFEQIVYQCDILNNMAFNWAQLNFNLETAWDQSLKVVANMSGLLGVYSDKNMAQLRGNYSDGVEQEKSRGVVASLTNKEIDSLTNKDLNSLTKAVVRYEERLAGYIDTMAWVQVRLGLRNQLGQIEENFDEEFEDYLTSAYSMLSEEALLYSTKLPEIYYHLARICINHIDLVWQSISAEKRDKNDIEFHQAQKLSVLLHNALLYIRHANRLNPSGNLRLRLRRIQSRLESYRTEWDSLYQPRVLSNLGKLKN